jgi:hypothetical protein
MSERVTGLGPGSEVTDVAKFGVLPVAAPDLVAWFPFRQGDGSDATAGDRRFGDTTDYSATVNGTIHKPSGGVTDIKTGENSGAFDFDGTDDFIRSNTQMPLDVSGNSPRTLMYFLRPDTSSSNLTFHVTFGTKSKAASFGSFHTDVNGSPRLFFFGTDPAVDFDTGKDLTLDTYQHVAISYDGSVVRVFVNGVETPTSGVSRSLSTVQEDIIMGSTVAFDSRRFYDGTIDGVRVYDTALTQFQINQIYLNTEP